MNNKQTAALGAYLYDVVDIGIIGVVPILCDIYFRMYLHLLITKTKSVISRLPEVIFFCTLLILSWQPFYWLVPIFVDTNQGNGLKLQLSLSLYAYFAGTFFFNTYYALLFARHLCNRAHADNQLQILMYKSIAHAVLRFVFMF